MYENVQFVVNGQGWKDGLLDGLVAPVPAKIKLAAFC